MSSQVEEMPKTASSSHVVSEAKMIDRSATSGGGGKTDFERQSSNGSNHGGGSNTPQLSSSAGGTGSGLGSTPVQAVTAYLRNLLGLSAKPTKRTLSEEAECGSPDSLREWLRQGSNPNEIDAYGYTPLVNACLRGCRKTANVLISNGADVNKKAMHGYTPLHAAAQVIYIEIYNKAQNNSNL